MNDEDNIDDEFQDELDLNDPSLENEEGNLNDDPEGDDGSLPKGTSLSPEQIAELAAQTAMRVQPRQQQQKELSPEELDQRLNRYKVSPEIVKLLRDPEAAPEAIVGALQALADGAAKHAVTSAQLLFQNDLSPLQQQIQAQQAYVAEQQTRTFVKHLGTQYPSLAGKDTVIKQAIQAVRQSGYQPRSKSDAQKQVALVARDIIRAVDPSFSLKANPARQAGAFAPRRASSGGGQQQSGAVGARSFADYLR